MSRGAKIGGRAVLVALTLSGALAPAGCPREDPEPDADGSEPVGVPTVEVDLVVPTEPVIRLVEAGAEPRRALRSAPTVGEVETAVLELRTSMQTPDGEGARPTAFPPLRVRASVEIVHADASLVRARQSLDQVEFLGAPGVPAKLRADLDRQLRTLEAYRADLIAESRGWLRGGTLELPAQVEPSGREVLRQIGEAVGRVSIPFPEEPVGSGATWTATSTIREAGSIVERTTTYQLMHLDGHRVELTYELTLRSADEKLTGRGKGQAVVDLRRWTPTSAQTRTEVEVALAPSTPGRVRIDAEVGIRRIAPPAE
jgi:hypothetical protein